MFKKCEKFPAGFAPRCRGPCIEWDVVCLNHRRESSGKVCTLGTLTPGILTHRVRELCTHGNEKSYGAHKFIRDLRGKGCTAVKIYIHLGNICI